MPRNRLGTRGDKGEPQRTWRGAKGRKNLLRLAMMTYKGLYQILHFLMCWLRTCATEMKESLAEHRRMECLSITASGVITA
jgi:hypothetical protein